MTNWTEERCANAPAELEIIGTNLYVQRRNIDETEEGYICESREVTFDEYNFFEEIKAINTDEAIEAYTMELIEEGIL